MFVHNLSGSKLCRPVAVEVDLSYLRAQLVLRYVVNELQVAGIGVGFPVFDCITNPPALPRLSPDNIFLLRLGHLSATPGHITAASVTRRASACISDALCVTRTRRQLDRAAAICSIFSKHVALGFTSIAREQSMATPRLLPVLAACALHLPEELAIRLPLTNRSATTVLVTVFSRSTTLKSDTCTYVYIEKSPQLRATCILVLLRTAARLDDQRKS